MVFTSTLLGPGKRGSGWRWGGSSVCWQGRGLHVVETFDVSLSAAMRWGMCERRRYGRAQHRLSRP